MDNDVVAAALEDPRTAPISDRLRAGMAIVEAMTLRPEASFADVIAEARAQGLDDEAVEDAANVAFHFNHINRIADAFDFDLPSSEGSPLLARLLDRVKMFSSGRRASPSTLVTDDGLIRPVEVQLGYDATVRGAGTVPTATRIAVEAFAARLRGGRRPELPVPEVLHGFLTKLARSAYKITDEEVEALRVAGYEKDAIFEITLAGAFGASVTAMENLFAELHAGAGAPRRSEAPSAAAMR